MLSLIRIELKAFFKKYGKIYAVFLILALLMGAYAFFGREREDKTDNVFVKIGIINEDKSPYSKLLVTYLTENEAVSKYAQIREGAKEDIIRQFKNGELSAYITIPPNLINDMTRLKNTPIGVTISNENPTLSLIITQALLQYEKYISAVEQNCQALYEKMMKDGFGSEESWEANEKLSLNLLLTILNREIMFEYEEVRDLNAVPVEEYYGYALLSLLVLYGGLLSCYGILNDKRQGVMDRNLSLMSYKGCLFGMSAANILKGLLCLWPVVPVCYFMGISALALGVFILSYVMFALILQILIFCIINTTTVENTGKLLSTIGILFFFFFLAGGGIIPITYLPGDFLYLSKCTPVYWIMMLLCGLS